MKRIILLCMAVLFAFGCSSGNLEDVKAKAPEIWKKNGFEVVTYEGYEWGQWGIFGSSYGGAIVWHRLKKVPDNGITYSGNIQKWGDEYHVYGPTAIDALRTN